MNNFGNGWVGVTARSTVWLYEGMIRWMSDTGEDAVGMEDPGDQAPKSALNVYSTRWANTIQKEDSQAVELGK